MEKHKTYSPFVISLVLLGIFGCTCVSKYDKKIEVDPVFMQLFNAIAKNDTISFVNEGGFRKKFIIARKDSILCCEKTLILNRAPYKSLQLQIREIGKDTLVLKRENIISVSKTLAYNNPNSIGIEFNNLIYNDRFLPELTKDPITLGGKVFKSYFVFETIFPVQNPEDTRVLYVTLKEGIIGFQTLSGVTWGLDN